jgi:hypothetical protein
MGSVSETLQAMPSEMNLLVYSCVTGQYDSPPPLAQAEPGVDHVLLCDPAQGLPSGWKAMEMPTHLHHLGPAAINRYAKMHPHLLFPGHDASVYVDGNVQVLGHLRELVESALRRHGMAAYAHPFRRCIYQEGEECARAGHAWCWELARQMGAYRQDGFAPDSGMFECNVLIRNHRHPDLPRLMQAWWTTYLQGVKRDQISLPYLSWKLGIPIENLGRSDQRFTHRHFRVTPGHSQPFPLSKRARGNINRQLMALARWCGDGMAARFVP